MSLGETRSISTVLSYMRGHHTAKSIEIEHETGLRQPEVSVAMQRLEERGYITHKNEIAPRKGRPAYIYTLSVDMESIIRSYETQIQGKKNEASQKIQKLKALEEKKK